MNGLRRDSEEFLKITLKKREEIGKDVLNCGMDDFTDIPNIRFNIRDILDDLKIHGCISNSSSVFIGGYMTIYLTMEGIDYFTNKSVQNQEIQMNNNTNNFYGNISQIQFQQGTTNSTQIQTITTTDSIDFDKVAEFVTRIKKYDAILDDEYGEYAPDVRKNLAEMEDLVQNKENPEKIKSLLTELKNLSIGVAGSLIATGIIEGIKLIF
jgi:hypothetical protein